MTIRERLLIKNSYQVRKITIFSTIILPSKKDLNSKLIFKTSMKEDILKKTAKEYYASAQDEYNKRRYNSAVVLYFKSLVAFVDLYLCQELLTKFHKLQFLNTPKILGLFGTKDLRLHPKIFQCFRKQEQLLLHIMTGSEKQKHFFQRSMICLIKTFLFTRTVMSRL